MRREIVLALILALGIGAGGGTIYVSMLRTQVESLQNTIYLKNAEISNLKTLVKIIEYQYGSEAHVKIGAIAPSSADLKSWETALDLAEEDINSYCEDFRFRITFDFLLEDAQSQPVIHLEKVQTLKSIGINLIIGGGWSSQAQGSLSYINENNMLLVSPSSSSPPLRAVDNFFTMSPTVLPQVPALAEMWETWGIKAVIFFHRSDPWGEGLYQAMNIELSNREIEILESVAYEPETTDFSSYLALLEDISKTAIEKYGDKKYIGIQILSLDEQITFLTQAEQYPNLKNLIWFSTESGGRSQTYIDQVGEPLVSKRMFSPLMAVDESSPVWVSLDTRYREITGQTASFSAGFLYDSAWLIALSILETQSLQIKDILPIIRAVASKTYGVTGCLSLDEYGDREPQIFDIWGYYKDPFDGVIKFRKFGEYNSNAINVIWDYAALTEAKTMPPSQG